MKEIKTELKQHKHADFIRQYAELFANGDIEAGWWRCERRGFDSWIAEQHPTFDHRFEYRITKTDKHPDHKHAAVKAEWEKIKDAGTHELWANSNYDSRGWISIGRQPSWFPTYKYEIRPIAKPKLKLIDKSKLPVGAMTNWGKLVGKTATEYLFFDDSRGSFVWLSKDSNSIRLAPMTEWLYWGGGQCPVPDGVIVELTLRSGLLARNDSRFDWEDGYGGGDIIAYRILGLADGWTDDDGLAK